MDEPKRLRLTRPCSVPGPSFEEREGGSFCLHCQEMTFDLVDATRSEVVARMRANGGKLCGRVRVWPSGEVRFRAEAPPRGLSALGGAALALALAACDSPSEAEVHPDPSASAPAEPEATQPDPLPSPPPSSALVVPPETTLAGPPPSTSTEVPPDGIDHSTDSSADAADHRGHRHRHTPVQSASDDDDVFMGALDGL